MRKKNPTGIAGAPPPIGDRLKGNPQIVRLTADFERLKMRHGEQYETANEVRDHVNFVLEKPEGWYPHARGRLVLFRKGNGEIPSMRIDLRRDQDGYQITSVYRMGAKRAAHREAWTPELSLIRIVLSGPYPPRATT